MFSRRLTYIGWSKTRKLSTRMQVLPNAWCHGQINAVYHCCFKLWYKVSIGCASVVFQASIWKKNIWSQQCGVCHMHRLDAKIDIQYKTATGNLYKTPAMPHYTSSPYTNHNVMQLATCNFVPQQCIKHS